jgi:hypothetical protein
MDGLSYHRQLLSIIDAFLLACFVFDALPYSFVNVLSAEY